MHNVPRPTRNFLTKSIPSLIGFLVISMIVGTGCKTNVPPPPDKGPVWLVFTEQNSRLIDNHINWITTDSEGKIWLATDSGAATYLHGIWGRFRDSLVSPVSHSTRITSIIEDRNHSIWFGLYGGGAVRYNQLGSGLVWQRYNQQSSGLIYDVITSVSADLYPAPQGRGDVWIATLIGVSQFTPSTTDPLIGDWTTYTNTNTPQLGSSQVAIIRRNPNDNTLWFGTRAGTIAWAEYTIGVNWHQANPPNTDYPITSIAFDPANTGWFGTSGGVWRLDHTIGGWVGYTATSTNGKLPAGQVNAVTTDRGVTRWFGTYRGLARLSDTTWTLFKRDNSSLPSDTITALCYDVRGNLWIGTTRGVVVHNPDGTDL